MKNVNVLKLNSDAIIPTYASPFSAGADLYALIPEKTLEIKSGETVLVHTGIALEIPEGYVGMIFARSGIATKRGLAPANKVGVIDSDYRGELMISLHNHSDKTQVVENGERVSQLVIMPYLKAEFTLSQSLDETERGTGGFGSTGTK